MTVAIEVEHLTKRYGSKVAVQDVSFEVTRGEIFGILGPNGAGKTTTVECVQGLRQPDDGAVRLLGVDSSSYTPQLRRRIGSQLQESALPDRMKVWEALQLFSSLGGSSTSWRSLLGQWGLEDRAKASFSSLSGGERQRLFVALALVNDPEVVFLDELTQGLDPGARHVAWDLIAAIRERGTTVVLVTHYMDEAEELCDRVAVFDRGKMLEVATPQELIADAAVGTTVRFSTDQDVSWLKEITEVQTVKCHGPQVEVEGTGPVLALVAAALVSHDILPLDLRSTQPSLEEVYLRLTGRKVSEE